MPTDINLANLLPEMMVLSSPAPTHTHFSKSDLQYSRGKACVLIFY